MNSVPVPRSASNTASERADVVGPNTAGTPSVSTSQLATATSDSPSSGAQAVVAPAFSSSVQNTMPKLRPSRPPASLASATASSAARSSTASPS